MARKDLRMALATRLAVVKTRGPLKRATPKESNLANWDRETLAFAAMNPDHSEPGRALALSALEQRLGKDGAHQAMDQFINALPTPGYLRAADIAENDAVFFGAGRYLRIGLGVAASIATVLFIALFFVIMAVPGWDDAVKQGLITQDERTAYDAMVSGPEKEARLAEFFARPGVEQLLGPAEAATNAAATWAWWAWIAFPLWALATSLRQKPARILLLRKFNNKELGRSIEKMSNANLRPYGHVFTLADKHFKRNPVWSFISSFWASPFTLMVRCITVPIGFVRRFWDRSRDGPILIWNANDFRHFARRFEDRGGLNLEMARTQRKTIMVRTSDAWWQHVVELIMHACDVVVIDMTDVAAGTIWELRKIPAEDVGERVVFTCREDRVDEARTHLRTHGFGEAVDIVQVYDRRGRFKDKVGFRDAMRQAMLRRLSKQAPA